MLVANERREEIADDPARAGLDLDRDGHAGRKIDCLVFDLHLSVVERHAGGVDQFLAFRLAAARFRSLRLLDYSFLWLVAGNGVVRDGDNLSGQQAIARESFTNVTEAVACNPSVLVAIPPMLCVPGMIFLFCHVAEQELTLVHVA